MDIAHGKNFVFVCRLLATGLAVLLGATNSFIYIYIYIYIYMCVCVCVCVLFRLTNWNILSSSFIFGIFISSTCQFHAKYHRWCSKCSIYKYSQYLETMNITSAPTTQSDTKVTCHYRKRVDFTKKKTTYFCWAYEMWHMSSFYIDTISLSGMLACLVSKAAYCSQCRDLVPLTSIVKWLPAMGNEYTTPPNETCVS